MHILLRSLTIASIVVFSFLGASAQEGLVRSYRQPNIRAQYDAAVIIRQGIGVVVRFDQVTPALRINERELLDAAREGVRSAGWSINDASDYVLTVDVMLFADKRDTGYIFKLSSSAGKTLLGNSTTEIEEGATGGITLSRTVTIMKNNQNALIGQVQQIANLVAQRYRREITSQGFNRRPVEPGNTNTNDLLH